MRWWLFACALLGGCQRLFDVASGPDGSRGSALDAGPQLDGLVDADATCKVYGHYGPNHSGLFSACFDTPLTGTPVLEPLINTDISASCARGIQGAPVPACVVVADSFVINSEIDTTGSLPLVLIARTMIEIAPGGFLNASSLGSQPSAAAAANWSGCAPTVAGSLAGGGGAGGSLGTLVPITSGGPGGQSGVDPGTGGVPAATTAKALHGGCGGGGGAPESGSPLPNGGASGGAIYLIAGSMIVIDSDDTNPGRVFASGAPGGGGPGENTVSGGGGGGGGSGGMIVFDSPLVMLDGRIEALGGGGGGGGGSTGNNGQSGIDTVGGAGGTDGNNALGGNGAPGFFGSNPGGGTGQDGMAGAKTGSGGGGGGGGGGGVVYAFTSNALTPGEITPPVFVNPQP